MKKAVLAVMVGAVLVGAVLAGNYKRSGTGGKGNATATVTRVAITDGDWLYSLSIFNTNGADVWAQVNCTTAEFATVMATTSAVPIPAESSYTFRTYDKEKIQSWCFQTLSGTGEVVWAGQ